MMPNNSQPTPPLPDELWYAIKNLEIASFAFGQVDEDSELYQRRKDQALTCDEELRHAIYSALAQAREDSSLRERAERLRCLVRAQLGLEDDGAKAIEVAYEALEADDLADDLQSAQEVVKDE